MSIGLTRQGCISCLWSAEQRKCFFPCPRSSLNILSRKRGLVVPSCVSLLILHTQDEFGAYSRYFFHFPQRRRPFFILSTAIGSVPSLSGDAIAYRWHRANNAQGSSGCCLLRYHHRSFLCASLFPHPLVSSPSETWFWGVGPTHSHEMQSRGCLSRSVETRRQFG